MTRHIVEAFEDELERLRKSLTQMGEIAASQLSDAVAAVTDHDEALASRTVQRDVELDTLERAIAEDAVTLLALRQPMAGDLRSVVAAIKIAADIEKIGDLAKGIAKRSHVGRSFPGLGGAANLRSMADLVVRQIEGAIHAFAVGDAEAAVRIWSRDAQVDDWHSSIFRELLTYMMEDPRTIGVCTQLMFMAKNLERVGDHCTHIADTTYFLVRGERLSSRRPKGEDIATLTLQEA